MIAIRILILFGLIFLIWLGWRRLTAGREEKQPSQPIAELVRCCKCQVHVPRKEAIESDGAYYCREHAER